jgi:hypothetical protein
MRLLGSAKLWQCHLRVRQVEPILKIYSALAARLGVYPGQVNSLASAFSEGVNERLDSALRSACCRPNLSCIAVVPPASHSIAAATARMLIGTIGKLISSSSLVSYWFGCKPSALILKVTGSCDHRSAVRLHLRRRPADSERANGTGTLPRWLPPVVPL